MYTQKTPNLKAEELQPKWYLVDAADKNVGRLATQIANIIRGKNKTTYSPHIDSGDFVVVVNAEKVNFSGNKWEDKKYYKHSNFVGGLKVRSAKEQLERDPSVIITKAVKGMLGKSYLGKKQLTKLKVFTGPEHTHEAQKPETFEIK